MASSPYNTKVRPTAADAAISGIFTGKPVAPVSNPKAVGGIATRNALKSQRAQSLPPRKKAGPMQRRGSR